MFSRSAVLATTLTLLSLWTPAVHADFKRGCAWGTDDRWAPKIGALPLFEWCHHWADGHIAQMQSKVEQVPMFWGPKSWDKWNKRKSEMYKSTPKHLMGFNEPDIASQSNMDPNYAAQVWMQEIQPWKSKGTSLGSPAIAYSLDWMGKFLTALKNKGGGVDFICIHWYGSWRDLAKFKTYVQSVHNRFGKPIWITEVGITSASGGSQGDIKNFMIQMATWLDTQTYVQRVAWFGCFPQTNPPDSYATGKNGLFTYNGNLADMAYWWGYTKTHKKRTLAERHRYLSRDVFGNAVEARDEDSDPDHLPAEYDGPIVDCDETCQLRDAELKAYADTIAAREPEALPEPEAQPLDALD